jgi:hypothetical protein
MYIPGMQMNGVVTSAANGILKTANAQITLYDAGSGPATSP